MIAGLLWLFLAFDLISGASLGILLTYAPIVLIGVGLDYLQVSKAGFSARYILHSIAMLMALMLIGPTMGLGRGTVTERFSEPVGNVQSVQVNLELASAPTDVFSLHNSTDRIDAELTHVGTIEFSVRGQQEKAVNLRREAKPGNIGLGLPLQTHWDIGLSLSIPLALTIDARSGSSKLELAELNLSTFNFDGGSGSTQLTLPASSQHYGASIDAGSGSTNLRIADDANLDLGVDVGSESFTAELGRVDMNFEFKGGSGSSHINLPNDAAVRVEVRDDSSGSLTVRGNLKRISGSGDEGVWESANFEQAINRIGITVHDAGSSSITIR